MNLTARDIRLNGAITARGVAFAKTDFYTIALILHGFFWLIFTKNTQISLFLSVFILEFVLPDRFIFCYRTNRGAFVRKPVQKAKHASAEKPEIFRVLSVSKGGSDCSGRNTN